MQLIKQFGSRRDFERAVHELQSALIRRSRVSRMSVRNTVKSIQDIMRQDTGVDGDAQRISQLCWMFFLKIIDDQDQELELLERRLPLADSRRRCSGARGPPTPRASPARRSWRSSTTSCSRS